MLVLQLLLLVGATVLLAAGAIAGSGPAGSALSNAATYVVIGLGSAAMGLQGAAARRAAVADVPTTVITSTLTGLMVDSPSVGPGRRWPRRLAALGALLSGAVLGALLVTWLPLWTGGALASVVVAAVVEAGLHRCRRLGQPLLGSPISGSGA